MVAAQNCHPEECAERRSQEIKKACGRIAFVHSSEGDATTRSRNDSFLRREGKKKSRSPKILFFLIVLKKIDAKNLFASDFF